VAARALHLRNLRTGADRRLPARGGTPLDPQLARSARTVAFTSIAPDGTPTVLAYDRRAGRLAVVGPGNDPSISSDGAKVAFASRAADLDPGKTDDTEGVFVRDLARARTTLVSAPSHVAASPVAPAAPRPEARIPGSAVTVSIFDNQFGGGSPTVHVRPGGIVGWDWRGRESHSVTVLRGAEHFATRIKAGGLFAHRFTREGVYRIVCSLHSPGMGMTVVVR
jgi:plastocyanin